MAQRRRFQLPSQQRTLSQRDGLRSRASAGPGRHAHTCSQGPLGAGRRRHLDHLSAVAAPLETLPSRDAPGRLGPALVLHGADIHRRRRRGRRGLGQRRTARQIRHCRPATNRRSRQSGNREPATAGVDADAQRSHARKIAGGPLGAQSPHPPYNKEGVIQTIYLGRIAYDEALTLQQELVELRHEDRIANTLLLLEHPPVLTLGRNARRNNILATDEMLARKGVSVHEINRGGDVTYHGPGQLVGYPIFDLRSLTNASGGRLGPVDYVRRMEEALIRLCAGYGVLTGRVPGRTGVWVGASAIPPLTQN